MILKIVTRMKISQFVWTLYMYARKVHYQATAELFKYFDKKWGPYRCVKISQKIDLYVQALKCIKDFFG